MKRITRVLAAMAMFGLAATTVQATEYLKFTGVSTDIYALDWNQGNALVQGGIPVVNNDPFVLYYQAKLGNFNNIAGNPITGTGLNSSYEITVVAGFGEKSIKNSATSSDFILDTSSTTNFFKVYYDTNKNANNLAGTGFNDGTLIMSGKFTDSFGNFSVNTVTDLTKLVDLDQFGANNWVGTKTVIGAGGTSATVDVDFYDTTYITTPIDTLLVQLFLNTSTILPYLQVDPSKLFTDASNASFAPNIGTNNGIDGPDMLFQADANSSPIVTPEPSTMVLLGAGLFGLSVFIRRRKNN